MLNSLTIKARLYVIGLIAITGVIVAGATGINSLASLQKDKEETLLEIGKGIRTMLHISAANVEFKTQVQEWKNILIRGSDPGQFDRYKQAFSKSEKRVQEELKIAVDEMREDKHALLPVAEDALKLHAELGKLYAEQIEKWEVTDPASMQKADKALSGKDRPMTQAMTKLVEEYEKGEVEHMASQLELSKADYLSSRNTMLALVAGVLIAVLSIVAVTVSAINRQIVMMLETLTNLRSSLDLSIRLRAEGGDEIATASRAVNALLDDFHGVVSSMKDSAAHVSSASEELADSVSQLSSSVAQQNEATGSMAASVEELAVSVTHIADSSASAQSISNNSAHRAQEGGAVIERTVAGMVGMTESLTTTSAAVEELGRRSQEIGSIASVIKDIADQTNLLALNAAIEAARAGETGRGFAVVADEVRKLAERTAKATAEIETVISAIQSDTQKAVIDMHGAVEIAENNALVAREAGEAIISIRGGSSEVVNVTTDISIALKEQTTASDLIARQVELIATMSDENTAALTGVQHASESMKQLSSEMRATVNKFKV